MRSSQRKSPPSVVENHGGLGEGADLARAQDCMTQGTSALFETRGSAFAQNVHPAQQPGVGAAAGIWRIRGCPGTDDTVRGCRSLPPHSRHRPTPPACRGRPDTRPTKRGGRRHASHERCQARHRRPIAGCRPGLPGTANIVAEAVALAPSTTGRCRRRWCRCPDPRG